MVIVNYSVQTKPRLYIYSLEFFFNMSSFGRINLADVFDFKAWLCKSLLNHLDLNFVFQVRHALSNEY